MAFPLEDTITLPAAHTISWWGHQPWTGSCGLPALKNSSPGALRPAARSLEPPFSVRLSQGAERSRVQCVLHTSSIPALERGALSVAPVNLNIYLGNNLNPPSPLQRGPATGTQRMFFCFLLAEKSQHFCAHAWFPYPLSAWSRAVWGLPTH